MAIQETKHEEFIWQKLEKIDLALNFNNEFNRKSAILFGLRKGENTYKPLLYISKPKHVPEKEYKDLLIFAKTVIEKINEVYKKNLKK